MNMISVRIPGTSMRTDGISRFWWVYALVRVFSKGIESSSALHMIGNISGILMAGFGFGKITSEATAAGIIRGRIPEVLFLLFILYAGKKLHWFDEVKRDDVAAINSRRKGRKE